MPTLPSSVALVYTITLERERLATPRGKQGWIYWHPAEFWVMHERKPDAVTEGLADSLPLSADPLPLRVDEGGVIRVGKGRISLDLVVEQYENGMTPEDMARATISSIWPTPTP